MNLSQDQINKYFMTETFDECRHCASDACYLTQDESMITWRCMDCGFYTNTYMLKNSDLIQHMKETLPDLFNDIAYLDEDGFWWYPMIVNKTEVGVISPIGSSKDNWVWGYVPAVLVSEHEKFKYPIKERPGEFYQYKNDITQMKSFARTDFILALQEASLLNEFIA